MQCVITYIIPNCFPTLDLDHSELPKRGTLTQLLTFKNFKVVVLLLLAIIATVMFAIVREEDAAWKNLAALSQDTPKCIHLQFPFWNLKSVENYYFLFPILSH